jgi:TatD DNase family protein
MNFKIFDSHCHLQDKKLKRETEKVIQRAVEYGVENILVPGWDLGSSREAVVVANKFENVYAACGVHPHDSRYYDENVEEAILKLTENEKVVSLGEIGLDYYRDLSPRNIQKEVFKKQLKIAEEKNIPVIIHTRESIEDTINIISDFNCKGVFHAFDYSQNYAAKLIEMGFFIGIGGVVTYRKSKIYDSIKDIPLDYILVETDAPYLTPYPYRGKRNEPAYTRCVVKRIAEVKSKTFAEVAEITYNNTKALFGI